MRHWIQHVGAPFISSSMDSALNLLCECIQIYKTASHDGGIYVKI